MSTFEVSTDKQTQLAQRMASLGVRETDIQESFVRSGGHGGQNVNKVATCVMLLHRPSGVQVKCQETRQQGLNRFLDNRASIASSPANSFSTRSSRCERNAWQPSAPGLKRRAAKNSAAAAARRNACSPTNPATLLKKNSAREFRRSKHSVEAGTEVLLCFVYINRTSNLRRRDSTRSYFSNRSVTILSLRRLRQPQPAPGKGPIQELRNAKKIPIRRCFYVNRLARFLEQKQTRSWLLLLPLFYALGDFVGDVVNGKARLLDHLRYGFSGWAVGTRTYSDWKQVLAREAQHQCVYCAILTLPVYSTEDITRPDP